MKPAAPDSKVAAQQLEAFFLRQLLAEARPEGGGGIEGGFAGDTFKSMLDEAIADKMSAAGGIGLAKTFGKQLGQPGEEVAPPQHALPMPSTHIDVFQPGQLGPQVGDAPRLVLPVIGRPSSAYGMRNDPIKHAQILHPGFDLAAPTGTAVGAAAGGTVTHAGPAGTYGNLVTVRHPNGYETRYAHLSKVDTQVGAQVQPGQLIGEVGTTGYSTGPHLHFEVRHEGKTIDPRPLLPLNESPRRTTR